MVVIMRMRVVVIVMMPIVVLIIVMVVMVFCSIMPVEPSHSWLHSVSVRCFYKPCCSWSFSTPPGCAVARASARCAVNRLLPGRTFTTNLNITHPTFIACNDPHWLIAHGAAHR